MRPGLSHSHGRWRTSARRPGGGSEKPGEPLEGRPEGSGAVWQPVAWGVYSRKN